MGRCFLEKDQLQMRFSWPGTTQNFLNEMVTAGKTVYPFTMYVNAWISPVYPEVGM